MLSLLDLHIRDTIVILGGDGNFYMTGSTGDNIRDSNDGVELWPEIPGIVRVDFAPDGKIFVTKNRPAFILQTAASETKP